MQSLNMNPDRHLNSQCFDSQRHRMLQSVWPQFNDNTSKTINYIYNTKSKPQEVPNNCNQNIQMSPKSFPYFRYMGQEIRTVAKPKDNLPKNNKGTTLATSKKKQEGLVFLFFHDQPISKTVTVKSKYEVMRRNFYDKYFGKCSRYTYVSDEFEKAFPSTKCKKHTKKNSPKQHGPQLIHSGPCKKHASNSRAKYNSEKSFLLYKRTICSTCGHRLPEIPSFSTFNLQKTQCGDDTSVKQSNGTNSHRSTVKSDGMNQKKKIGFKKVLPKMKNNPREEVIILNKSNKRKPTKKKISAKKKTSKRK